MSRKLFVGGLDFEKTTSESLYHHFVQYGEIVEAIVIYDKYSGRSKGYGFVTFVSEESAHEALVDPNPVIDGRKANVNIAYTNLKKPLPISGHGPVPHSPKPQHQQQRHNMAAPPPMQQPYATGGPPPPSPSAFGFQFGYPYGQYTPGPALFYPVGAAPGYAAAVAPAAGAAAPIRGAKDTNPDAAHMAPPPQPRRQNFPSPIMYFLQPSPGYQQQYFMPMSPTMIIESGNQESSMETAPPAVAPMHHPQMTSTPATTTES